MWITVPIFIIFQIIGGYTLVFKHNISKIDYFIVWFTLLIYILALAIK